MSLYERVHSVTVDLKKTVFVLDEAHAAFVAKRPKSGQRCIVHVQCNSCRRLIGEMTDYMYIDDEEAWRTTAFFLAPFRIPDDQNPAIAISHGVTTNGIAHPELGVIRGTAEIVHFLEDEVRAGRRERRQPVTNDRRTEVYVFPLERGTGDEGRLSRTMPRGGSLPLECVSHGERRIEVDYLYNELRKLRALPDWETQMLDTKTVGR